MLTSHIILARRIGKRGQHLFSFTVSIYFFMKSLVVRNLLSLNAILFLNRTSDWKTDFAHLKVDLFLR